MKKDEKAKRKRRRKKEQNWNNEEKKKKWRRKKEKNWNEERKTKTKKQNKTKQKREWWKKKRKISENLNMVFEIFPSLLIDQVILIFYIIHFDAFNCIRIFYILFLFSFVLAWGIRIFYTFPALLLWVIIIVLFLLSNGSFYHEMLFSFLSRFIMSVELSNSCQDVLLSFIFIFFLKILILSWSLWIPPDSISKSWILYLFFFQHYLHLFLIASLEEFTLEIVKYILVVVA